MGPWCGWSVSAPGRRRGGPCGRGGGRVAAGGSILLFWTAAGCLAVLEAKTSTLQSELFSRVAGQMTFWVEEGPSDAVLFPADGPYDRRLGYVDLPGFIDSLERQGYAIASPARTSDQFAWYFGRTGIAPSREKTVAGPTLLARAVTRPFRTPRTERSPA